MDDGGARVIDDNADLEWRTGSGGPDEHLYGRIIGFEDAPVIPQCMHHVLFADTVLAGACIDVHSENLDPSHGVVNTC